MNRKELEGNWYISFVRDSVAKADSSTEMQLKLLRTFGDQMGMINVNKTDRDRADRTDRKGGRP